jgi:amino acid adenylation domain-containing protein
VTQVGGGLEDLSPAKRALLELRLRQREAERRRQAEGPGRHGGDSAPLSSAQQRLWLLDQLHPGLAAYNVGRVLRLRGRLDAGALETALAGVVERHAVLRSALVVENGEPVQRARPAPGAVLQHVDCSSAPDPEAAAEPLIADELRRPFDLAAGVLIRGRLIRLADDLHVLVLVLHHTASDEGSKMLIFDELGVRYTAALEGRAAELGELAIGYADYAAWERERADGPALAADLDWWREQLAGAPAELGLPHDAPRPAVSGFVGARYTETADAAVLEELRALARAEGATLFMTLLAAFKALLARYSGQADIVVGAPVSTRSRPELEDVVGLFGNTLVLRTAVDSETTFRQLVARVRETAAGAFAHQAVPFERLVEELGTGRDLSRPPIAEALFNFIEQPADEVPRLEGLEVTALDMDPGVSKVDLGLIASVRDDGLRLMWEYSTELFTAETIVRMTAHLRRILSAVVADPDVPIGALPLMSEEETALATGDLEATAAPIPAGAVHELVAARAAEQPEAPAVRCGAVSLTYRELDERANGIASVIVESGVPAGAVVGLRLKRSADLIAAPLGVMKAGCAYLPLDPSAPRARTDDMLADSGATAVLVDGDGAGPAELGLAAIATAAQPPGRAGDGAAYLIYTSGSTGRPKGVVVEHRNLVNLLASMCREPGIGAGDALLAVTTPSFDIAALELFGPLLAGGRVVVSEDGVAADPDALAALLRESGATVMQATPSTWQMLIDAGWAGAPGLRALCGGEALPRALAESLAARVGELWNVYGPTETTIWSTCWRHCPGDGPVPIGGPIANTACYVLDARDRPVPPGVVGELCIGGAGVARGYHAREELTRERFAADPFAPGGRIYRTGDLVRRAPDGELLYLGRGDDQVKVRGVRVELGEIEATLARHPSVREAAVALRDDEPGDPRLIAYVTGDAPAEELRALATEALPAAMVPAAYVALARMPRTPNGKLDRRGLPRPSGPAVPGDQVPPVGELEERLAAIWAEVLGAGAVGRTDDFFALGGHSLSATRLMARVNGELDVRMPMRAVFEAPTVAGLARAIELRRAGSATADVPPPPLRREPREGRRVGRWALDRPLELAALLSGGSAGNGQPAPAGPDDVAVFPASFQQRRVWFLDRLEPGGSLYTVPLAMTVEGALDVAALRAALDGLADRHEILRTTLVESDGTPLQVVDPQARFALEEVDAADEAAALEALRAAAERPFDLAAGPLARAFLARVAPDRFVFALLLHHAVADGWSLQLLTTELAALMRAEPLPAQAIDLQYGDYAVWQQRWLRDRVLDVEVAWWRATLLGAPAEIELPADRPRPAVATHAGARHVASLPGELLQRLDALAAEQGATLFMVLTAAVQVLLARYTGESDVVVGAPVSGRARPEFERLVGYLANTLVLRTRLEGDPDFATALARVKQTTLDALAHQDVPFDRLVEALAPDRDLSRNPLFQVLVMLQDDREPVPDLPGARAELIDLDRGVSRFDLSLSFARRNGALRVAWEYSSDLFDASTVQRFSEHLACLLEGIVADPACALSRLPIVPAAERRTLAQLTASATAREIPPVPVHELVAAQAAEQPDAVAVTCDGRSLSYRELDERANRLAHALVDAGAGPGVLVGLYVDRSVDLIAAIHGVLRAGAAYIPLDPDYPRERVEFMLADSQAPIVLTRSDLRERLDPGAATVICVDDAALAERPAEALPARAGLDDLVYVIYTSGSTGRPKGVMLEHGCLVNLLSSMAEHPGVRPGETMLGLTTPAFDLSVPDLYLPLVCGGTLALATAEQAADPRKLAEVLRSSGAAVAQATPSTWRMLLEDGWEPERPMRIVVGGEAVPVALAERLAELMDEAWNFYGPTETCVWSTCWRIEPGLDSEVPIGRPLGNTACYIVDAHDNLVPAGVSGELLIGGAGVARGYLGREELTAEKFSPDPFVDGARVYRTGDLVRLRPDGLLGFVGRRDNQIKLRGYRIELGEITTSLEAHPSVRQAVVIVSEEDEGDQRLIAYVVGDDAVATAELRSHLGRTLPVYMIPNAFVHLAELPLTPNGKLDRKALKVPDAADRPSLTPARTPVEEQLVGLWAEALRRDDVGVHDNLFHLGAHSLLVTRVVARIRETMSVELPLRRVYEAPTIAEQASDVVGALLVHEQEDELESLLAELEETP